MTTFVFQLKILLFLERPYVPAERLTGFCPPIKISTITAMCIVICLCFAVSTAICFLLGTNV